MKIMKDDYLDIKLMSMEKLKGLRVKKKDSLKILSNF
jgi:hypothetical protein